MFRLWSIILFLFFVAAACDRVKDQPVPDPLKGLELKAIQLDVIVKDSAEIPILTFNTIPGEANIRISEQPKHGIITLNAGKKTFIYKPFPDWKGGLDSAKYIVFNSQTEISGKLLFRVADTTQPCQLQIPSDFNITIQSSDSILNLPQNFDCNGKITGIFNAGTFPLSLENGKIKAQFPLYQSDSLSFNIQVCTPDSQCRTATVHLIINGLVNPCIAAFQPKNDIFKILPNFLAFSIPYDSLLKNDLGCPGDLKPASLTIIEGPKRGTFSYRNNAQGRFLRYVKDSTAWNTGADSLTYQVTGQSGASGTAKILIKN